MSNTNAGLRHRNSGYKGDIEEWREFLSCWYQENRSKKGAAFDERFEIVKRDPLNASMNNGEDAYRALIYTRQSELGVTFPRSYVDFLIAYQPELGFQVEPEVSSTRMVRVGAVDELGKIDPIGVKAVEDASRGSGFSIEDDRYYVYGEAQSDSTGRTEYLRGGLCVGHYGADFYESIVLHPEVLTADGEMEAEAYFDAGSRRAPNFAALMRWIYGWQRGGGQRPSEEYLRTTCAGLLTIEPWWK